LIQNIHGGIQMTGKICLVAAGFISTVFSQTATFADVWTYHNDNERSSLYADEIALSPGRVNAGSFGRLFTVPVDGKVDAQPLYAVSVPIFLHGQSAGRHNLLVIATEHGTVYGVDADSGALYWKTSVLAENETPSDDRGCGQVTPEIGVTADAGASPHSSQTSQQTV
jgi:outer membrane protein assembly factor BamB